MLVEIGLPPSFGAPQGDLEVLDPEREIYLVSSAVLSHSGMASATTFG